ncbi:ornithine--oxo-acid transaminase [Micromonospora azadirachtae]|uniref:ornithine aminotransferase n=1 Tax=Micromonospora azadirachtae TaxID=1970735 RepID=A0ABW2ZYT3_9ACTN
MLRTPGAVRDAERWTAHNYHPLPVVISSAEGAWLTDVDDRRYLDFLAGYSALNFGHRHPQLVAAAHAQLDRLTLTSRAFIHDQFADFCRELAELCGKDLVLPMNTGAEAVETGIKVARKWGYQVKGVPAGQANIVVAEGNFHGRTTTIVSFSTDEDARADFGPYTPGFTVVPYGDLEALTAAIDENTVAVLIEPIQGEQGVVVPPEGYLPGVRQVCTDRNVLFIADEIQSGLGRTGATFACDHEGVVPDMYLLGKALGGGIVPVSAVVANTDVLGVLKPGEHGSTFGGNPLACAAGLATLRLADDALYRKLDDTAAVVGKLASDALAAAGVPHRLSYAGSMFSVFFTDADVVDYDSARTQQAPAFKAFFHSMLAAGVYLPPSAFESWFVSAALDDAALEQIAAALPTAARAAAAAGNGG